MKNNRLQELIKILLSQYDFITIKEIAQQLQVSQRTIHNYLDTPEFLTLLHPAKLIKKPNKGILIQCDALTKANITTRLQSSLPLNYDKKNDLCSILLRLLTIQKEITQEDLCLELYLSLSTLTALLNEIDTYAKRFHCTLDHRKRKGIYLTGSETNIRSLFYSLLTTDVIPEMMEPEAIRVSTKSYSLMRILLSQEEVQKLIQIMNISENIMNTYYCDEDYNRLLVHLSILVIRTRLGFYIPSTGFADITTSQEYYYATLKKTYLEKEFQLHLDENEVCYLALLLLGTRKQINISNPQQNIVVLEKFINLLSIRLNVELSNDFELKQNLMNHLKPAINRMKHGVVSKNPLLEQIRLNFTEIYMAVITTIEDLEYMENIFFDSNEIGYICLHIIAAVNRPNNHKKLKVALICNEGLSIEIFLKNIIESYFQEISINEIYRENSLHELHHEQYDLIINSTSKQMKGTNIISIETNFTQKDHSCLRHFLMYHSMGLMDSDDLYKNYLLFFEDEVDNQEQLLSKYCAYLYEKGYVKENFYASVVSRTKISSTYVARGIALPHGAKDEVNSSIILMINLHHSITWDDEDTDFVILVAANDTDVKNYSFLFRKIMKIAAQDECSTILKTCRNLDDLKQLLEKV